MSLPAYQTMPSKGPKDQIFELERIDYLAPEARGRIGGVTAGMPLWKMTMTIGTWDRDRSDLWRAFILSQRGAQKLFYGFEYTRSMPRLYPSGLPVGFTGAASSWSQAIDGNGYAVLTLNGLPTLTYAVHTAGAGYVIGDTGHISGGSGTGTYTVLTVSGSGGVLTISVVPGTGYSAASNVSTTVVTGTGNGALKVDITAINLTISAGDYVDFRWGTYKRALVRFVEGGTSASGVFVGTVEPAVPNLVPTDGSAVAHLDNPSCLMKLMPGTQLGAIGRRGAIESGTIMAIQDLIP